MKKILIVGDSYTYGSGCDDRPWYFDEIKNKWIPEKPKYPLPGPSEQCWGSLLKHALPDYEVINQGSPGNDNSGITLSALAHLNTEDIALVIYAGTSDSRMRIAQDHLDPEKFEPANWVMSQQIQGEFHTTKKAYQDAQMAYMTHLYHSDVYRDNSVINIYAIHAFANAIQAKLLWNLLFWEKSHADPKIDCFKQTQFLSIIEYIRFAKDKDNGQNLNSDYLSPDGHANTIGHKVYFEEYLLAKVKYTLGIN